MKYRKKPIVIDAIKFNGKNYQEIALLFPELSEDWMVDDNSDEIGIATLEGFMSASPGDYIIKGIKGEFYPCKPDIFEASYEKVSE